MSDPSTKTTAGLPESMPAATRLDRQNFSHAIARPDGSVLLELWADGQAVADRPARYVMTPGQALLLIQGLAGAAQRALKEQIG